MTLKAWIGGAISAVSGAVVTAGSTMIVAPAEFNFDAGIRKVLVVAAFSAAIALFNYLRQSPLPGGSREAA